MLAKVLNPLDCVPYVPNLMEHLQWCLHVVVGFVEIFFLSSDQSSLVLTWVEMSQLILVLTPRTPRAWSSVLVDVTVCSSLLGILLVDIILNFYRFPFENTQKIPEDWSQIGILCNPIALTSKLFPVQTASIRLVSRVFARKHKNFPHINLDLQGSPT